jgi:hypothetical protein
VISDKRRRFLLKSITRFHLHRWNNKVAISCSPVSLRCR